MDHHSCPAMLAFFFYIHIHLSDYAETAKKKIFSHLAFILFPVTGCHHLWLLYCLLSASSLPGNSAQSSILTGLKCFCEQVVCHSASSKSTFTSVDSPLEDDRSQCSCAPVTKDDITNEPAGRTEAALPIRLLLVSSKIRNASAIQQALNSDVIMLPYKYDSSTLENILELVDKCLNGCQVTSVAFILSSLNNSLQLSGKDEKVLSRETLAGQTGVQQFFQNLVNRYLKPMSSSAGIKTGLHFLACAITTHTAMELLAHALTDIIKVPVGVYKHLSGAEISAEKISGEEKKYAKCIGSLYFRLEKLRFWSGQRPQSLAGFEKIRTVGKGAYGAAVLYRKKDDDSLVILKEINMHDLTAAERQMALNEVKLLAMLDHPNIISYYDSFEEDGILMIEMEYADGGTLAQFLANRDKALEERDILLIFQHIVSAIRYTHKVKILHRDLKTANIFLTKEGVAKVGDFGIAKLLSTSHKGASTVLGTPYYISPEMCESKPYDEKSDIWALGCILYEMACRQKTFEGSNLPALVNKIMKGQFAPVKGDYSQELKDLITSMLRQNPDERPSAHHLLENVLPQLLSHYESTTTDLEDDICSSLENVSKKRMRSVLYYLEISSELFTPVFLPSRIRIRQVAVGRDHVIVISMEKLVYSWGEGVKGQLGHGNTVSCKEPELIESLKGKAISRACCGDGFSAFLSENGIVMTCGDGSKGCLGHGDWNSNLRPRLIESLLRVDILTLACGPHHVVTGGSAGVLFSWGCGANGRLGLGTEESHCKPMQIQIVEPVVIVDIHCGNDGTMFLTETGAVLACGSNRNNKLGLNNRQGFLMAMKNIFNKTEVEGQNVPTPVKSLARFKVLDISMGSHHTAVIVEPGCYVYMFGQNSEGQLGIGNTKSTTGPVKMQALSNEKVLRVQCGDHFTVACTTDNHLYYWGLRFKPPAHQRFASGASDYSKDMTLAISSRSSLSKERCSSDSCLASSSPKEFTFDAYDYAECQDCNEECIPIHLEAAERSMDSSNGIQEHSDGVSHANTVEWAKGFQPISFSQNRSTSATSSEAEKMKDIEEESKIIFPPAPLINSEQASLLLQSLEKPLVLSNFFCHGENLFIQAETMAPPSKRRVRRKRSFRKKESVNSICMHYRHSASSREGGDEYSSETSEMDSQGTLPTWIKHELADSLKAPEVILTSEEEEKLLRKGGGGGRVVPTLNIPFSQDLNSATEEESQLNTEGNIDSSRWSTSMTAEETPKNPEKSIDEVEGALKVNKMDKHLTSSTGSDTNTDKSTFSSSNASEKNHFRKSSLTSNNSKLNKSREVQLPAKAKSPFSLKPGPQRNSSKTPTKRTLLGRYVVNRGITSLGNQKKREDVLMKELENMKSEKRKVEIQLEGIKTQLENLKENQQEVLRMKEENDKPLEDEIDRLRQKLQNRDQEIQEFSKIVQSLKQKVEYLQMESVSVRNTDLSEDSSSCASPREEDLQRSKKASKICSLQ
ncbi:Serine/threonine-protein kinase nekl-2,Serine/threonine-protein kinase Nek8,Serine/threonine-protein kinase Nek3,Serine/threonine-protein kinase Nek1,Serine/threonine-protein kinase Nek5,Serine/threonine-protein kinase Nek2,Probable serine/threonine-protein kinase nek3,Serine/threonine-protein kinase Nek4 [Acanthosepion pharaonis]|uniref:non-specific serine/threonine protein kinase n=1 Tax=Acanthosepion pharaonis TaxID=158019 RepID=A0A812AVI6_ACAPH|nr:Serine/threonine-protein kinase nekl-2,Serine/threonine-protein kinase Nek8,Serine/threonine-protein kinase Nek3,Serine/threonine-protein kinase Nek1,Serine/threonine-protein kinase Nek5,Serine/threonine-protein kinase Nek2,Probable serine/threonine-protein kinase nek3,Serine/threonine-protein kinase Nek4 [Sepia pharaonis]